MRISARRHLLENLVQRSRPIDETLTALSKFDFDSSPLVALKGEHVISLLADYVAGNIDEADVEKWADAVEVRDDLFYEAEDGEVVKNFVYDLANPLLSGHLTLEAAGRMMSILEARQRELRGFR